MSKKVTVPALVELRNDVKDEINTLSAGGGEVRSRLVKQLAEQEISKRVTSLTNALTKREELQKEFDKINRPDIQSYGAGKDGRVDSKKPTNESYSQKRAQEISKLRDQLDKIDTAVAEAFDSKSPNFDKLNNLK